MSSWNDCVKQTLRLNTGVCVVFARWAGHSARDGASNHTACQAVAWRVVGKSVTNPRDALHHGERAGNKDGRSVCDKRATELN